MKLSQLALASSLVLGSLAAANTVQAASLTDTAVINFTGLFQDGTCKVTANNQDDLQVFLGSYKTTQIKNANDTTDAVPFTLSFSDCGAITNASITLASDAQSNLFPVSGVNRGNVGVGVSKTAEDKTYIASTAPLSVDITDGKGSADLFARYVKIGDTALTQGQAPSAASINITYR